MRRKLYITFILITLLLVACTNDSGAVSDSKEFLNQFSQEIKEYKSNPTKDNLKKVVDLVKNTDIKLSDEDKKQIESAIEEIQKDMSVSTDDIKNYWNDNKDSMLKTLGENTSNILSKLKEWIDNKIE